VPVVIADDHERERKWLRELVTQNFANHLPIHEATNGQQAIQQIFSNKATLAILDIEMPVLSGIKAAEQVLQQAPQTPVVILSHHSDEVWVRQLWKVIPSNGAFAYVLKDSTDDQIVEAVKAVLLGDCWIHPRIQRMLLQARSADGTLSEGELEVLAYICLGLTDKAIARRLYLTEKAIQARLKSVYTKLGMPLKGTSDDDEFNHRCRAINVALRRGLINRTQLDEWEAQMGFGKGI
jgi:DNA-binding NarL/FixJ family response regulator